MFTTSEQTLEEQSLWYKYKTAVWLTSSAQSAVVHNIMRALRAIRFLGLAYVSVPITSGWYWYKLQLENPGMAESDLLRQTINNNYQEGWNFLESLRERVQGCPIIFPPDLVPAHQEWEQAHFQALWLSIIAEQCTEIHMAKEWEYSNGGVEEFTHVMQLRLGIPTHRDLFFFNTKGNEDAERKRMRNIKVYDCNGHMIELADGMQSIKSALAWIESKQFQSPRIVHCLSLLQSVQCMVAHNFYQ